MQKEIITETKNFDTITISKLINAYQSKPEYQVNFNKYVLGIFKTRLRAINFIKKWIKRHDID